MGTGREATRSRTPVVELRNEFAAVEVRIDRMGLRPRLHLTDLSTGKVVMLDALELESLVQCIPAQRDAMVDPAGRWSREPSDRPE